MEASVFIGILKKSWFQLVGNQTEFALEARIYNALCIVVLIATAYFIPFNYFIGSIQLVILTTFLFITQAYLFYLSRFKKKTGISFLLFGLLFHAIFAVNYLLNSGVHGPTLLLFALTFVAIIAIAPQKQYPVWTVLNITLVLALMSVEYWYPDLLPNVYKNRISYFADVFSTYFVFIIITFVEIAYIRSNYNSERKKATDRALQLERLNREKNKLFSIISHDLRMPLATVQHYLELLSEVELKTEEKHRFEAELLQITRNTQDMLSNLLFWSKTQLSGQKVNLQQIDAGESLQQVIEIQKANAGRKGITLTCTIQSSLSILADPDMLQLVIRNLIHNAIKFTPAGKIIDVTITKEKDTCLIAVKDSGAGILPEKQQTLFSLKATSTYGTENEKGVGLGLVLCKEFVTAQNGKIWFESTPGEGAVFFVSMPIYAEKLSIQS